MTTKMRMQPVTFDRDTRLLAMVLFLVAVFLMGGSSRADTSSLVILRPVAVLSCGYALWTVTTDQVRSFKFLFAMAGATLALVLVHLIPLPPVLWTLLPGRELVVEIDKAAGLGGIWRPIALVPDAGWNALYALFVPLAALLLGVQLELEHRQRLLVVILAFALTSGLLGLLQSISSNQGILHLYRVNIGTSSAGMFANRNHQALLLAIAFPLLSVYASTGARTAEKVSMRTWIAVCAAVVLVPLILVTGSRGGVVFGLIGLLFAFLFYRRPLITVPKKRKVGKIAWRYPIGAFLILCLGGITVIMSRAEALRRLTTPDQMEDMRLKTLEPIWNMILKYFPVGSGIGSYVEVFQVDEPYELLKFTYSNHAHNDWVELVLTGGLPALALLAIAVAAYARIVLQTWRYRGSPNESLQFQRLGCVIVGMLGLGSVVDYPLRTPTLGCIFIVAALWCARGTASENSGAAKRG